jgi:hypothetical protein
MTCRQLGGPCDVAHHGDTADEVIKAQDRHLKQTGDSLHEPARQDMKGRWRHPMKSLDWYRMTKQTFADLVEDQPRPA